MQEIGEIERSLEEYKAFRSFEEDVDGRVQNLSGSIKELEQKKRDVNVTALDESVKAASYKLGFIKVGIGILAILTLLSGICTSFFRQKAVFAVLTFVFALLTLVFVYMGKAVRDNLQRLDHNRNILLSEMRDIDRELSAKQEEIRRIFSVAGVEMRVSLLRRKPCTKTRFSALPN